MSRITPYSIEALGCRLGYRTVWCRRVSVLVDSARAERHRWTDNDRTMDGQESRGLWVARDQELVERAQDGDRAAFGILVEQYRATAFSTAYALLGNAQDAEDATQEAPTIAWLRLADLRQTDKFAGWLYRITQNCCRNLLRRCWRLSGRCACLRASGRWHCGVVWTRLTYRMCSMGGASRAEVY